MSRLEKAGDPDLLAGVESPRSRPACRDLAPSSLVFREWTLGVREHLVDFPSSRLLPASPGFLNLLSVCSQNEEPLATAPPNSVYPGLGQGHPCLVVNAFLKCF